VKVTAQ